MEIDIEKLTQLVQDADTIFMSREAEQVLLDFYEIKAKVEEAEKMIKDKLKETGLKLTPYFKDIKGQHVKVTYQSYGIKYRIDPHQLDHIPKELYRTNTKYVPDAKAIDAYRRNHRKLPDGVMENERKKSVRIAITQPDSRP